MVAKKAAAGSAEAGGGEKRRGIVRATLPLELSFRALRSLADVAPAVAADQVASGLLVPPKVAVAVLAGKGGDAAAASPPLIPIPQAFSAVRLDNNELTDISGLSGVLRSVVTDPSQVSWLDLSFNHIGSVAEIPTSFPELRTLYLHANEVDSLQAVSALSALPHLTSLTLHGNPLRELPNYRLTVIAMLPKLKKLDFVPVSRRERERATTYAAARKGKFPMAKVVAPGPMPIPSAPGSSPKSSPASRL
jgi:Leucine-rich repeat